MDNRHGNLHARDSIPPLPVHDVDSGINEKPNIGAENKEIQGAGVLKNEAGAEHQGGKVDDECAQCHVANSKGGLNSIDLTKCTSANTEEAKTGDVTPDTISEANGDQEEFASSANTGQDPEGTSKTIASTTETGAVLGEVAEGVDSTNNISDGLKGCHEACMLTKDTGTDTKHKSANSTKDTSADSERDHMSNVSTTYTGADLKAVPGAIVLTTGTGIERNEGCKCVDSKDGNATKDPDLNQEHTSNAFGSTTDSMGAELAEINEGVDTTNDIGKNVTVQESDDTIANTYADQKESPVLTKVIADLKIEPEYDASKTKTNFSQTKLPVASKSTPDEPNEHPSDAFDFEADLNTNPTANEDETWVDEVRNKIMDVEQKKTKYKIENERLRKAINEIQNEKRDVDERIQRLEKDCSDRLKTCSELVEKDIKNQEQLCEIKQQLEDAEKAIKSRNEEIVQKDKTITSTAWTLEGTGETISKLKEHETKLRVKLEQTKADLTKAKEDGTKLNNNIQKLTKEIIQAKEELEESEKHRFMYTKLYKEEQNKIRNMSVKFEEVLKRSEEHYQDKKQLEAEKQGLLLRLSKLAGANLTYNNPNIADLSDDKRPTKLAEEFSELYDNQWTDAFEDVEIQNEEQKTNYLLQLLQRANQLCVDCSTEHMDVIKHSVSTLALPIPSKPKKQDLLTSNEAIVPDTVSIPEGTSQVVEEGILSDNTKATKDSTQLSEIGENKTEIENVEPVDDCTASPHNDMLGTDKTDVERTAKTTCAYGGGKRNIMEEDHFRNNLNEPDAVSPKMTDTGAANKDTSESQQDAKKSEKIDDAIYPKTCLETEVHEGLHLEMPDGDATTGDFNGTENSEDTNKDSTQVPGGNDTNCDLDAPDPKTMKDAKTDIQEQTKEGTHEEGTNKDKERQHMNISDVDAISGMSNDSGKMDELKVSDGGAKKEDLNDTEKSEYTTNNSTQEVSDGNDTNGDLGDPEKIMDTKTDIDEVTDKDKERQPANISDGDTTGTGKRDELKDPPDEDTPHNNYNDTDTRDGLKFDKKVGTDEEPKTETKVLESDFELLQNDQKKVILDARKFFELKLSKEFKKVGTSIIVQERGIDPDKQESIVTYIRTCIEVCWSMCRHEPPVHVDFPDISDDVSFDSNKYKPYTQTGKHVAYVVWPALYLHEGGPMLSKGVAQGKS